MNLVDSGIGMRVFGVVMRGSGAGAGTGVGVGVGVGVGGGRTGMGEVGMGMGVMKGKVEREDRRVLGAALAAVCNIVNEFSPLRPVSPSLAPHPSPNAIRSQMFSVDD